MLWEVSPRSESKSSCGVFRRALPQFSQFSPMDPEDICIARPNTLCESSIIKIVQTYMFRTDTVTSSKFSPRFQHKRLPRSRQFSLSSRLSVSGKEVSAWWLSRLAFIVPSNKRSFLFPLQLEILMSSLCHPILTHHLRVYCSTSLQPQRQGTVDYACIYWSNYQYQLLL